MNVRIALLTLLAAAPMVATAQQPLADRQPAAPAAVQVPITFARSGRETEIRLLPKFLGRRMEKEVVLTAFGREWSQAADVLQTSARCWTTMTAPAVRVPTAFSIVDRGKRVVGELVVYPDRDITWDKTVTLYSCGAPTWFDQWAAATGLPVKQLAIADLPSAKLKPEDEKGNALLILGSGAAGKDLPETAKLAAEKGVNVLVLDAPWFGESAGPVGVAPAQMREGLSELAKQRWAQPLKFASHRRPWPGIANRWAWIMDETGLPLAEAFCLVARRREMTISGSGLDARASEPRQMAVLSYLPWERQIGRSESADAALLELVRASARATEPEMRDVEISLVDPPDGLNLKDRPVLSAAVIPPRAVHGVIDPEQRVFFVTVIDLRGKDAPATYLTTQQHTLRELIERSRGLAHLLILGDDKMLDDWDWLKLDRAKKRIDRPGVIWLPDDELPPTRDSQIRLMLKLTALGVPLAPPQDKENRK